MSQTELNWTEICQCISVDCCRVEPYNGIGSWRCTDRPHAHWTSSILNSNGSRSCGALWIFDIVGAGRRPLTQRTQCDYSRQDYDATTTALRPCCD